MNGDLHCSPVGALLSQTPSSNLIERGVFSTASDLSNNTHLGFGTCHRISIEA